MRNTFSLAFDGKGRLVGAENAGDRDDSDELNVIEEGRHYGFPWRIGGNATPQQFPGYDPSTDLLLNPESGAVQMGAFYDDPGYPAPPEGVTFAEPVRNLGPAATRYRDAVTGEVLEASASGASITTFTAHRSPLGLVFDTKGESQGCSGCGFVLSWTSPESPMLADMEGEGEDLLSFQLSREEDGAYTISAFQQVTGFTHPISAAIVRGKVYVLESGVDVGIWEVEMTGGLSAEEEAGEAAFRVAAHPNPAADAARVTVSAGRSQRVAAELYTVLGQRVVRTPARAVGPGTEAAFDIDTGVLAPGVYVLRVQGEMDAVVQRLTVSGR